MTMRLLEEVIKYFGGTKTAAGDLPGSQPVRGLYWVQRVPYPDWLLIYEIKNNELVLCLTRTGNTQRFVLRE